MAGAGRLRLSTLDRVVIGVLIAIAVTAVFVHAATVWWWVVWLGLMVWTMVSRIPDLVWLIFLAGFVILEEIQRSRRLQAAQHAEVLERLQGLETAIAAVQEKRWDDLAVDEED
jgi:ABC-type arginine transport system permease subunit